MKKYGALTCKECVDSAMSLILVFLILMVFTHNLFYVTSAIILLLFTMTIPTVFKPFAFIWLNFSKLLGGIISRLLLSIIFYVLVTPVGLIRRLLCNDTLKIKAFKDGPHSVFNTPCHLYTKDDIIHPY